MDEYGASYRQCRDIGERIMSRKALRLAIMISALVAGIVLCPIASLEAPEWKVRVVDRTGKPVRDVVVRESCRHYSAEFGGHEEDLRPDNQGNASFSKKVIRVPIVKRLLVIAAAAADGAHASFGPHCFVFAFRGDVQSNSLDWNGSPARLESTIVADRYADLGSGPGVH
jgi:hypothetical protein